MPGVTVTTATFTGPSATVLAPSGQAFFVGMAERGPTDVPALLRGYADYETWFGSRITASHLADTVKTFFAEGGSRCYVLRSVGASATTGTVTLNDRAGSPLPTLRIDAASPGDWSDDVDIVVADLTAGTTISVLLNSQSVESAVITSPADAVEQFAASKYIRVTDLASATAAPSNLPAAGTFSLSAGDAKHANVNVGTYTSDLAKLTYELGPGAVSIPGVGTTVHSILVSHAAANNRVAILSCGETASTSAVKAAAANVNSEFAGMFTPWVKIPTDTGTRNIPPDGYVAGVRNRAHAQVGSWQVPAGAAFGVARYVLAPLYTYSRADGDDLDAGKVSAIRSIAGTTRLYGWRSLSNDVANYSYLQYRDTLNTLVWQCEQTLEQFVFATIDGRGALLSSVNGALVGIVDPIARAGGFFARTDDSGKMLDPGYSVDTGNALNTLDTLAANEIKAKVSVRMSPTAALVSVTIVKVGLLAGL